MNNYQKQKIETKSRENSEYNDYNMLSAMSVANGISKHTLTKKQKEELKQIGIPIQIIKETPEYLYFKFKRPETEFLDETR